MDEDFVASGSPSGWYKHPRDDIDYFYTGAGFGTVEGEHIRRRHPAGRPDFEAASRADAAAWVRDHGVDSANATIRTERIVTTEHLPGYRIVRLIGLVTELTSASGWTAAAKGNQALDRALAQLGEAAAARGANAIIGFHAATFGAHGGLTSGLGGDAVGVLLMGTAVVVVPDLGPA